LTAKTNSHGFDPKVTGQLQSRRTFTVKYSVDSEKSANFLLVLAKNAKVSQIDFVSGDETLRQLIPALSALKFDLAFPDTLPRASTKVRRSTAPSSVTIAPSYCLSRQPKKCSSVAIAGV
jgi:hypothetical protein